MLSAQRGCKRHPLVMECAASAGKYSGCERSPGACMGHSSSTWTACSRLPCRTCAGSGPAWLPSKCHRKPLRGGMQVDSKHPFHLTPPFTLPASEPAGKRAGQAACTLSPDLLLRLLALEVEHGGTDRRLQPRNMRAARRKECQHRYTRH